MQSDESDEEPPEALKHAVCFIPCSAGGCCQNGKQPRQRHYLKIMLAACPMWDLLSISLQESQPQCKTWI